MVMPKYVLTNLFYIYVLRRQIYAKPLDTMLLLTFTLSFIVIIIEFFRITISIESDFILIKLLLKLALDFNGCFDSCLFHNWLLYSSIIIIASIHFKSLLYCLSNQIIKKHYLAFISLKI